MERIREEQPVDLPWVAAASLKRDTGHPSFFQCVAHPDPGPGAFLYSVVLGSGIGKNPDPGSGAFLYPGDLGSGIGKSGSGIRNKLTYLGYLVEGVVDPR
jgi:hypothetical protein